MKKQEVLKKARLVILQNEDNRTEKQKEIFQRVQKSNLEVRKAWKLRDDVQSLFESKSLKEALQYARLWIDRVLESGIQEVGTVARRFQNHCQGVGHALGHPQSHAKAERWNGKIQEIKAIGRGDRKFENFRAAVLFFNGGLKLDPQLS